LQIYPFQSPELKCVFFYWMSEFIFSEMFILFSFRQYDVTFWIMFEGKSWGKSSKNKISKTLDIVWTFEDPPTLKLWIPIGKKYVYDTCYEDKKYEFPMSATWRRHQQHILCLILRFDTCPRKPHNLLWTIAPEPPTPPPLLRKFPKFWTSPSPGIFGTRSPNLVRFSWNLQQMFTLVSCLDYNYWECTCTHACTAHKSVHAPFPPTLIISRIRHF